jgi:2,5-diketo-D-gluconate reductase A
MTAPTMPLRDGSALPAIGLGTWPMDDAEAETAVRQAINLGYRLVDTAAKYGNEVGVGRGVVTADVPREEIVVTSKLRGSQQGYDEALVGFEETLNRLGLDYVDLYLIHWPLPRLDRYVDSWRAMIKLRDDGLIRSIGVSNFCPEHLDRLLDETGELPTVNQIELHPYFPQPPMQAVDRDRGVLTQSWSPLGRVRGLLDEHAVVAPAHRLGRTPGQVILRWHVQQGLVPIPKSSAPERQRENLEIFDFALGASEMDEITALARGRFGGDPVTHEEF